MLTSGLLAYYNIMLVTDVHVFVFLSIDIFFHDDSTTMQFTFSRMFDNREIIDGSNKYCSPFCIAYRGCEHVFHIFATTLKDLTLCTT